MIGTIEFGRVVEYLVASESHTSGWKLYYGSNTVEKCCNMFSVKYEVCGGIGSLLPLDMKEVLDCDEW